MTTSIYHHILRGSAWALLLRWTNRCIGLVSTVILARLLTPEDFGIVAIAGLSMGLLRRFSSFGVGSLLIRDHQATKAFCDTAWTLRLGQGLLIAAAMFLLAPWIAEFFREPRAVAVIRVLAVGAMISGFESIGMTLARKELDFARDFRFNVYGRLAVFVVTVPLAFYLQSYWALVIGQLAGRSVAVLLSFMMHEYRPRIGFYRARDYLRFAKSVIPLGVAHFLHSKADVFISGRLIGTTAMGGYNIAAELSAMMTEQITSQIGRALFPSYSKISQDPRQLAEVFVNVFATMTTIVIALGVGLASVSEEFVAVVLGEKWLTVGPLLGWLGLYGAIRSLSQSMGGGVLIATGNERLSAILMWTRLTILSVCCAVGGLHWGIEGIAIGAVTAGVLNFAVTMRAITSVLEVRASQLFGAFWRPAVSAAAMYASVTALEPEIWVGSFLGLLLDVAFGAVVYLSVLLTLWALSGAPPGPERSALNWLRARLAR